MLTHKTHTDGGGVSKNNIILDSNNSQKHAPVDAFGELGALGSEEGKHALLVHVLQNGARGRVERLSEAAAVECGRAEWDHRMGE